MRKEIVEIITMGTMLVMIVILSLIVGILDGPESVLQR